MQTVSVPFSRQIAGALGAALLMSACTMSDDKMARWLVAPDKFVLYNCPELVEKAEALMLRERELEGLMAKAGQGADGRLVSSVAYRPDYVTVQGELNELRKTAAEKKCPLPSAPPAAVSR